MSYNISTTVTLRTTLTITPANAALLRTKHVLPEVHFLYPECVAIRTISCCGNKATGRFCSSCGAKIEGLDEALPIHQFWWYGPGSGYLGNLAIAASYTKGDADLVLVWEGGDSVSGIKIKDGVVTEHEVNYVLGTEVLRTLKPEKDGDGR